MLLLGGVSMGERTPDCQIGVYPILASGKGV
jgi:hypothetical protein